MKNLKSTILALSLSLMTVNSFARDVTGTGSAYVKVTKLEESRRFELCYTGKKGCHQLGRRDYKVSELKKIRKILAWETGASSVVSVLGLACAGVGVLTGGSAIVSAELFAVGADLSGAALGVGLIGGSIGGAAIAIASKYNPVSLYQKSASLKDEVIEDQNVHLDGGNEDVEDFSETLDDALRSI